MKAEYIETIHFEGDGYQPLINFGSWRVAVLKYCGELELPNLKTMQKHCQTDEVFILLTGHCVLFSGGKGETIGEIDGTSMFLGQFYNVKKGVWHTHSLDKDAMVAIVENQDTSDLNSPTMPLTEEQIKQVFKAAAAVGFLHP